MENDYNLFLDILQFLPEEVECFIQAPSLDNQIIEDMMIKSDYDYYKIIKLNKLKKEQLVNQELSFSVSNYFQNIQIKSNNELLFEGFDGVEFGTVSGNIFIPHWFQEKYIETEICTVSEDW